MLDVVSNLLSITQAAQRLGVHTIHIIRLIERGELEAVDLAIGKGKRCLRISESSVLSLLDSRRVKPQPGVSQVPHRRSLHPGLRQFC